VSAYWAGRRVLLTGHTGFKGAWLALWLHELGARVTGFSGPPPSDPALFDAAAVGELVDDIRGDVRDAGAVRAAVRAARPEIVLHLAAQALVRRSYADPVGTWDTNVGGTARLLEAIRELAPEAAVVVVTSDKCYANDGAGRAFHEDDPLGGHDPYSASKAAQELVAASFRDAYGLRIATARAGNVIGGGDWGADRLVPDFFRAAAGGEALVVRNPDATRPWQHVLDPLAGYLLLAERLSASPEHARAYNFGPDAADERSVRWIVERLRAAWPDDVEVRLGGEAGAHEAPVLRLDATLAREQVGWAPALALEDALELTVRWHAGGGNARERALEQLRSRR
jgi:CDP-glucose 4,6-dehydratase